MADPLVVPGVCRYTIIGNQDGFAVDNILDVHIDDGVGSSTREEAIADQASIIITAWRVNIMDVMVNDYQATELRWVDLNSEDGSTGIDTTGTGAGFPANGANTDAPAPAGIAWLARKLIGGGARGTRSGRMYVGGLPANVLDTNDGSLLGASFVTAFQTKMTAFFNDVNQDGGLEDPIYDSRICVVHNPPTGTPSFTHVSDMVVQQRIAFQRRRSGR